MENLPQIYDNPMMMAQRNYANRFSCQMTMQYSDRNKSGITKDWVKDYHFKYLWSLRGKENLKKKILNYIMFQIGWLNSAL